MAHGDLVIKHDIRQALISRRFLELTCRKYELLNLLIAIQSVFSPLNNSMNRYGPLLTWTARTASFVKRSAYEKS